MSKLLTHLAITVVVRFLLALAEIWLGVDVGRMLAEVVWAQPSENWIETANWSIAIVAAILLFWSSVWVRSRTKPAEPSVKQRGFHAASRISLIDFAKFAEERGWRIRDSECLHSLDLFDAVRQMAIDEAVIVFGRAKGIFPDFTQTNPLEKIGGQQWRDMEIDVFTFFSDHYSQPQQYSPNEFVCAKWTPEKGSQPVYFDIHLERESAIQYLDANEREFKGRRDRIHG